MSKSLNQRRNYQRYVQSQDYTPTIDESLRFNDSDESVESFDQDKTNKRRPVPVSEKLKEHFHNNWINWLIAFFVLIASFLLYDSKVGMQILGYKIDKIEEDVTQIKGENSKMNDSLHKLEIQTQGNRLRIELQNGQDKDKK